MTAKSFVIGSFALFLLLVAGLCGAAAGPEDFALACLGPCAAVAFLYFTSGALVTGLCWDDAAYVAGFVWIWLVGSFVGYSIVFG